MSVRRNVVANYLGQGWTALMQFAFVPLYLSYLGVEAFGLIGVFTMLQAWMVLLDLGMTPTLNREMARFTAGSHSARSINDLLRTLEWICVAMAAGIVLVIWGASGWLASDWLQAGALPVSSVADAIALMGIVIALRFVEGIYRGALMGLQRQVFFNAFNAVNATLRAAGAVAVLIWVSPTIEAFFIWQACASLFAVAGLALATHRTLPGIDTAARFSKQALLDVRHFAGGMIATTLLALLLTQVDKVLLSRLISLEAFGYYTLAATVASALTLLATPVTQAVYPRLTELATTGDGEGLAALYHRSAQAVTVLCAPPAMIMILLPEVLLRTWTGDAALSAHTAPLLALLALGTFLNGLMYMPYMLQLAHGWSGFAVRVNLVAVSVLIPAVLWATPRYGAAGAAWAWVALNIGYMTIGMHFMHRRLLSAEKVTWYVKDLLSPIAAAALATYAFALILSEPFGTVLTVCMLGLCGITALLAGAFSADRLRQRLFDVWPFSAPVVLLATDMKSLLDARRRGMLFKRATDLLRRKAGIDYRKSYAQCGEDVIVRTVFDMLGIASPSYLDVGAHHPTFLSNTYLFYEQGCHGVTVEPDPELHARFLDKRPRDVNLNIGIGPEPGAFELFIMSTRTLNTLSESEANMYVSQGYRIEARHRVEVNTIGAVIDAHFKATPDFLSIDVEGLDYEILQSLDPARHRPSVICVETIVFSSTGKGEKRSEIDDLLLGRGYIRFADTYINTIYVDEQSWINR